MKTALVAAYATAIRSSIVPMSAAVYVGQAIAAQSPAVLPGVKRQSRHHSSRVEA
jgi:hypothetical protein